MLDQPISMLVPRVVGFKLTGSIPEGVTATDVVLTITDMLRQHGVVGKFVEFYGEGIASVPLPTVPPSAIWVRNLVRLAAFSQSTASRLTICV